MLELFCWLVHLLTESYPGCLRQSSAPGHVGEVWAQRWVSFGMGCLRFLRVLRGSGRDGEAFPLCKGYAVEIPWETEGGPLPHLAESAESVESVRGVGGAKESLKPRIKRRSRGTGD